MSKEGENREKERKSRRHNRRNPVAGRGPVLGSREPGVRRYAGGRCGAAASVHAAKPAAPAAGQGEEDVIEALKRYKELLDQGVITQEEFDRKKEQLLGQ